MQEAVLNRTASSLGMLCNALIKRPRICMKFLTIISVQSLIRSLRNRTLVLLFKKLDKWPLNCCFQSVAIGACFSG
jgi:hypothetical protein